ncbi:fimbrial protein [Pinirhizobacter sp.]|jgi:major type 1 subunit fimbrin (pilin)|uniref:fimbrial protein n=1 Tax=Pinirhizobacter sp. TaxID=2950432 RepID=UPI002F4282D0
MNTKLVCAFALTSALAAGSAIAADGGTIRFDGLVTDGTCVISGGAGTDGGTGNIAVPLDSVAVTSLDTVGAVAGKKAFNIIVTGEDGGECVSGRNANFSFESSSLRVDAETGNLINALMGETNAQLQLLDRDTNTAIDLSQPNTKTVAFDASNRAVLPFAAQYFAKDVGTPGRLSTSVVYSVTYN